ncbi:MAG TPA: CHASE sensor domain-containing protein, partial [Casimicrobiaceae bacterium]|nr:CHASE sensor domain-containing protein [Casimicrobiaceae bacterium]
MAKYTSPLNADTVSPLNAPPVRLGLQTKLNLLAIGLIVATAVGISAFLFRQQVQDEQTRLQTQGMTIVSMLTELTEPAVTTADKRALRQILDTLDADRDIAYVVVLDGQHKLLASLVFGNRVPTPIPLGIPRETKIESAVHNVDGRRY